MSSRRNIISFCNTTIRLPDVLPKLIWLEISISPYHFQFKRDAPKVIALNVKFSKSGGLVEYGKQFPVLEKIVVSKVNHYYSRLKKKEWFEVSVAFLYKYFLHGESVTVRDVHVQLPPRNMKRFTMLTEFSNCKDKCVEKRVKCSKFFKRMRKTFPNLRKNLENI